MPIDERSVVLSAYWAPGRSKRKHAGWTCAFLISTLMLACGFASPVCQSATDWVPRIRALVDAGHFEQALSTVDEWMKAYPNDLDARSWHARLQAWTNQWKEAESEYRELIRLSPHDVDLLMGLADVLIWQAQYKEALRYLEQACALDPDRTDCSLRRAQALQGLGHNREARLAYQQILAVDGSSREARKGLEQIRGEKRHELRIESDMDSFSYAQNAASVGLAIRSRWNTRLTAFGSLQRHNRFGENATGGAAGATVNLSPRDALTIGGSVAEDNAIIPLAQAEFDYAHGFRLSERGPFRGIETLYSQRWIWYQDAHLLVLSPAAILYLPKDWSWMLQYSQSRVVPNGNATDWKPSGSTRLSFPIGSKVSGYLYFATGTENFGYADQIGEFSLRTWGAGLRIRIRGGQEIHGHGHYQQYSDGRTLTNLGISYALHF